MEKVVVFDIGKKKSDQAEREMKMAPNDRLLLCLNLMDLAIAVSPSKSLKSNLDSIQWIELKKKNAKPGS